jgi:hypothetical protein
MKPSKARGRFWLRTECQLDQAEEKRSRFEPDQVIKLLKEKGYRDPFFQADSKDRVILVDRKTGAPLVMDEGLIDEIAKKIGLLSGKWIVFVESGFVDELWSKIEKLVSEGRIWSAKISTPAYPWVSEGKRVICVYARNYLDEKDVMDARNVLKENGIEDELSYKPDIYTILGIYPDNMKGFHLNRVTRHAS